MQSCILVPFITYFVKLLKVINGNCTNTVAHDCSGSQINLSIVPIQHLLMLQVPLFSLPGFVQDNRNTYTNEFCVVRCKCWMKAAAGRAVAGFRRLSCICWIWAIAASEKSWGLYGTSDVVDDRLVEGSFVDALLVEGASLVVGLLMVGLLRRGILLMIWNSVSHMQFRFSCQLTQIK